jgi:hypothetical protein
MIPKIQMFCLFHKRLCEEIYEPYKDSQHKITFVRVGNHDYSVKSEWIRDNIFDANTLPNFNSYGANWAEYEFLLNLVSHPSTFDSVVVGEWIGMTQYDHGMEIGFSKMPLFDFFGWKMSSHEITNDINYFALRTFSLREYELAVNRTCMDYKNPQKLQGDPSCYITMAEHFNEYYKTNKSPYEIFLHDENKLPLCSSFIMHRDAFRDLVGYLRWIADNKNIDCFDPSNRHRQQGGLMERYLASWFVFKGMRMFDASVNLIQLSTNGRN